MSQFIYAQLSFTLTILLGYGGGALREAFEKVAVDSVPSHIQKLMEMIFGTPLTYLMIGVLAVIFSVSQRSR